MSCTAWRSHVTWAYLKSWSIRVSEFEDLMDPDGLSWIGLLRVTKAWRLMDSFLTPEKMKFGTFSESLTLRFWQQQTCDLTCCNHWVNCVWFTIRTIWLTIWFIEGLPPMPPTPAVGGGYFSWKLAWRHTGRYTLADIKDVVQSLG